MKNKVKLIVFDFDGTALGGHTPYDQFPKSFADFLNNLDGVSWSTNTTWSVQEQFKLIRRSGVTGNPAFLAGQTGRMLGYVHGGKFEIDEEYKASIGKLDMEFRTAHWELVREIGRKLLERDLVNKLNLCEYEQNIVSYEAKNDCMLTAWETASPLIASGFFYAFSAAPAQITSLLPYYMNKGDVIKLMQKRMGISPEETLVAGDQTNDLHMFSSTVAKYMICPGNADVRIKKVVAENNGIISDKNYSWGIIDGISKITGKNYKRTEL